MTAVDFDPRPVRHVSRDDLCAQGNLTPYWMNSASFCLCSRPFDAFSLDGLFQMTSAKHEKHAPGTETAGKKESTIEQAWWRISRLWCEMQSAAHGHDLTLWTKNEGAVKLRVHYVLGSAASLDDELQWDAKKEGRPVCRRKGEKEGKKEHAHRAVVNSFELDCCLPDPMVFHDVGKENATVTVSFVAVAVCMPSMYSWVRSATGAAEVFRDQ